MRAAGRASISRFLHCFADSEIAPGYIAWVVPGVGVTQIGVAAIARRTEPDLGALLRRLKAHLRYRAISASRRAAAD